MPYLERTTRLQLEKDWCKENMVVRSHSVHSPVSARTEAAETYCFPSEYLVTQQRVMPFLLVEQTSVEHRNSKILAR